MTEPRDIRTSLEQHLKTLAGLADKLEVVDRIARCITEALRAGGKIMTCGNGGSAAEALHLAEEMIGRFSGDRMPLAALCLSGDPTAITCISNDYGYEEVFARQVQGLGRKGDVLIVLSTSGKSANILRALEQARSIGVRTIGLLGAAGSPAESFCDLALTCLAAHSSHVQEVHLVAIHLVLEHVDHVAAQSFQPAGNFRSSNH